VRPSAQGSAKQGQGEGVANGIRHKFFSKDEVGWLLAQ